VGENVGYVYVYVYDVYVTCGWIMFGYCLLACF